MSFSDEEITYLRSQRLARIATVSSEGQPDVVPVGFEFDGAHFYIGTHATAKPRKQRNVEEGNAKVALVIDDLVSTDPWAGRFLRVYGTAEMVERQGQFGPGTYMRVTPAVSWSLNPQGRVHTDGFPGFRRTVHHAAGPAASPSASSRDGAEQAG